MRNICQDDRAITVKVIALIIWQKIAKKGSEGYTYMKKVIVGLMASLIFTMGCASVCLAETECNHSTYKYQEYRSEALLK